MCNTTVTALSLLGTNPFKGMRWGGDGRMLCIWLACSSHHATVFSANGLCRNTGTRLRLSSSVAGTTVMQVDNTVHRAKHGYAAGQNRIWGLSLGSTRQLSAKHH